MNRWLSVVGSILVTLSIATLSLAVDPLPRPAPFPPSQISPQDPRMLLSKEAAQKLRLKAEEELKRIPRPSFSRETQQRLRAPIPREVAVNTLLSGPATKSALTTEASKRGFSPAQIANVAKNPLPRAISAQISKIPIETAQQVSETALRSLNWSGGMTFTPLNIPRYGTGRWYLGSLEIVPVYWGTYLGDSALMLMGELDFPGIVILTFELPKNDPGLYAITIRLVNYSDGLCQPGWLISPNTSESPFLFAYYYEIHNGGWISNEVPIPLAPLSDKSGFVGLISANPTDSLNGSDKGMNRFTSQILIIARKELNSLLFSGITITRL